LFGSRISVIRLDCRRRLNDFLHLKLVANIAPEFSYQLDGNQVVADRVWGCGAGLKINSVIGPFELIASQGHLNNSHSQQTQYHLQFVFGARF